MNGGSRARVLAWGVAIVAGAVLPAAVVLASGHTLAWRDTARLFAPLRATIVEALRAGRLPLWNPHEALGIPLLAQMMHGVLHPVSIVAAFLAPHAGVDLLVVAYFALAALGAAAVARSLGASLGAAAVAGLGYGLSGYVLGMSAVLTYLAAASTAPWAIAALHRCRNGGAGRVAVAALAVAALHFAGDPQWTIAAVAIALALAWADGGLGALGRAAVAVAMGTAVAALQLAPGWVHSVNSDRSAGLTPEERTLWALAPARLVELVAPGFFHGLPGVVQTSPPFLSFGGPAPTGFTLAFVPSVFVGGALLALAAAGLRARRSARVLGVAAALSLWIALGFRLGAEQVLHVLPVWGLFRYSEKLVGPFTLCVAVLAAAGCDRVAQSPSRRWARALLVGGIACGAAAAAMALGLGDDLAGHSALTGGLVHAAVALLSLGGGMQAAHRRSAVAARFAALAAVLVFGTSAAASPFALRAGTPGVRESAIRALRSVPGLVRVATPFETPPWPNPERLDDADAEIAAEARLAMAPYNVEAGVDQVNAYTGLLPARLRRHGAAFGPDVWRALRHYSITHLVVKEPTNEAERVEAAEAVRGGRLVASSREWHVGFWEVPHRPWASFAQRIVSVPSQEEALRATVNADLAGLPDTILEVATPQRASGGRVLATVRRRDSLRIDAESEGDGVLVVNDAFWPGWRATIDGREAPIWRADYLVRAVPWPAGRHTLEMRYEPAEVTVGEIVSCAGLVAVALLGLTPMALRRRARDAAPEPALRADPPVAPQ